MNGNGYVLDAMPKITMEQVLAARAVIAGRCSTSEELALLLDLLGIGATLDPAIIAA